MNNQLYPPHAFDSSDVEDDSYTAVPSSFSYGSFSPRTSSAPRPPLLAADSLESSYLDANDADSLNLPPLRTPDRSLSSDDLFSKKRDKLSPPAVRAVERLFSPPPNPLAGLEPTEMIWNQQYQEVSAMEDTLERHIKLTSISNDFTYAALSFAKIIIAELPLSYADKTIKPLDVGGIAGGLKYSASGILFKIAKDALISTDPPLWMYGGPDGPDDEAAIRAAHGEINGAESYLMSYTAGLNVPLISLITYRGFTIVAIALIPVDKSTLLYGCADGGRTVHVDDPQLNELMETAGRRMNLKPHLVGRTAVSIIGPGDIEGHKGHDGAYYVLDFGRVMPPEAPPKGPLSPRAHRTVFFRFLRREFVSQIWKHRKNLPLCSDGFTSWDSQVDFESSRENADRIRDATQYLYDTLVPEHAVMLEEIAKGLPNFETKVLHSFHSLCTGLERFAASYVLHSSGLNCRHMGRVYRHLKTPLLRQLYLSSIVARAVKRRIESQMRSMMAAISYPSACFETLIVDYLNNTLLSSSETFWNNTLPLLVNEYFPCALPDDLLADLLSLRRPDYMASSIDIRFVIAQLSVLMNFTLTGDFKRDLLASPTDLSIDIRDIKSFHAKIRNSYKIEMSFADRDLKQVDVDAPPRTHLRLMHYARQQLVRLKTKLPFCPVLSEKLAFAYAREGLLLRDLSNLVQARKKLVKSCVHFETALNNFMYKISGYEGIYERYYITLSNLLDVQSRLHHEEEAQITRGILNDINSHLSKPHTELSDIDVIKLFSATRLPTPKEVQLWIEKALRAPGASCGDLVNFQTSTEEEKEKEKEEEN